ncbi:MAG: hypothetical protein ACXWKA_11555 [Xanthobacteraceae bacterium]
MFFKTPALNRILYVAVTASLVIAAHQSVSSFATPLHSPLDAHTRTEIISSQVVNRLGKGDKLPIHDATSQTVKTLLAQTPTSSEPRPDIKSGCEQLAGARAGFSKKDLTARCLAEAASAPKWLLAAISGPHS